MLARPAAALALSACLASLAGCTIVSQPEIPAGTPTSRIYVLTGKNWFNWFGVVDHAAVVLPGADDGLVQYGFGDVRYMRSGGAGSLLHALRIVTVGWFVPSRGTIERRTLGPAADDPTVAERETEMERRSWMRALELEVPERDARELRDALEAAFIACGGSAQDGRVLTPIADRQYHLVFENCQSVVAAWLAVIGVDTDGVRLLPRWSFWFRRS